MRKTMLTVLLSLGVALVLSAPALARDPGDKHGNAQDARQNGYQQGYRDGYDHGRADRTNRASSNYHSDDYQRGNKGYDKSMGSPGQFKQGYRQGYQAGYEDGYNNRNARYGDWDHQSYGQYGNRGSDTAYNFGYQDGLRDGAEDLRTRHSYRPTEHAAWKDADHGLSSAGGNSQNYKNRYRQGYEQGYQQGYGQQGYGQPEYNQGNNRYGNRGSDTAYNFGYQDGLREGAADRRTGHSYRPTEHAAWKDADHGLSSAGGNSQDYKNRYRQGYERGYQQGYGR